MIVRAGIVDLEAQRDEVEEAVFVAEVVSDVESQLVATDDEIVAGEHRGVRAAVGVRDAFC